MGKSAMKPTIITLSGKARHGKTTSCEILQKMYLLKGKRCLRMSYGDYVKEIAIKYYGWDGVKDEDGRALLQWLGTDKVRATNPTFWVDAIIRLVGVIGDDYDYVLIDDARFPDEITSWADYNIKTIHVERLDYESNLTDGQKAHISETALDGFEFDYGVTSCSLTQLTRLLQPIADKI